MVNKDSVFAEMEELSKEIAYHADLYFNKDTALIPNHIYDEKVQRFEELKAEHPELAELFEVQNKPVPIHEPGGAGLEVITFDVPMLSLKKALNKEELDAFTKKFPDDEFYDEYKLDGLAIQADYEREKDGYHHLKRMTTRGDGLEGENVTHSLPLFRNLPTKLRKLKDLPDKISVRGEGYLSIFCFESYNEVAIKKKSTPRNAASGFIRALEKNMDKNAIGLLDFNVYWSDSTFGEKDYESLRYMWERLGFSTAPQAYPQDFDNNRYLRDIPVDGIVRKIKSFARQAELGVTNRHPNYAIAYKFPNEEKVSVPLSIDWQVGKTGRVTPCVNYKAVKLGGVICDRASLDNIYQFKALELREDSVIVISRNGDVIPRLHRVETAGEGKLFEAPTECPSCGSVLEVRQGKSSAELVCNNVVECPAQLLMRCVALAGKRCLDIEDLGPVRLGQLIDCDVIRNTSDVIWSLKESHVGEKILKRIEAARQQPWHVIIKALGLPGIDLTRAKKLADALPESVRNGERPMTDVLNYLTDPHWIMEVKGFSTGLALPIGVIFKQEEFFDNARNILRYMTAKESGNEVLLIKGVITGSLGQSREDLVDYFGEHGIELVENLTKDCQFLLIGEKPSKSKQLKATELSIPMFTGTKASSIDNLIKMIKGLTQ